jgi:hypothetical protein
VAVRKEKREWGMSNDFWKDYEPEPTRPAPVQGNAMIYKTFEQWKSGNVLEHGVPRTEHYSEDQLDLVEMGWSYGYDAGRAVEQALDKKAENARELGLDYEPDLQAELDATNRQVEILNDALAESRREVAALKAVQEPVKIVEYNCTCGRTMKFESVNGAVAAQRQWVGLTDEEIEKACVPLGAAMLSFTEVARAIEAKLKEKNNG